MKQLRKQRQQAASPLLPPPLPASSSVDSPKSEASMDAGGRLFLPPEEIAVRTGGAAGADKHKPVAGYVSRTALLMWGTPLDVCMHACMVLPRQNPLD